MKNIFASGYGKETQENKKSVDYKDENANIFFNILFSAVTLLLCTKYIF